MPVPHPITMTGLDIHQPQLPGVWAVMIRSFHGITRFEVVSPNTRIWQVGQHINTCPIVSALIIPLFFSFLLFYSILDGERILNYSPYAPIFAGTSLSQKFVFQFTSTSSLQPKMQFVWLWELEIIWRYMGFPTSWLLTLDFKFFCKVFFCTTCSPLHS